MKTEQELIERVLAHLDRIKALRKDVVRNGVLVLNEEGKHVISPSLSLLEDEISAHDELINSYPHPLPEGVATFSDMLGLTTIDKPSQSRNADTRGS